MNKQVDFQPNHSRQTKPSDHNIPDAALPQPVAMPELFVKTPVQSGLFQGSQPNNGAWPVVSKIGDEQLLPAESLTAVFARTVRLFADRPALRWQQQILTYRQLDNRSTQLAGYLRQQGVKPGDFVGLLVPKSVELYVGMLAVLKAGAGYVPLDPAFPAHRIDYILGDCRAELLLTGNQPTPDGLSWAGQIIDLTNQPVHVATDWQPDPVAPDSTAYAIYTSGTTGTPKGVLIPHRSICALVQAEQAVFPMRPDDRVLQGFSVAFDASLEEIWLAFAAGAMLVPAAEETMKTPDVLQTYLETEQISVFSTVPTLLAMLDRPVASIRLLILGGEVCPVELVAPWASATCRVVNTYGPTEATVVSTYGDFVPGKPLTIGRPLPGYRVVIIDENGQSLPHGTEGEIGVGGEALATGYLNKPDLTASKFVAFTDLQTGTRSRLYRTGDLGRFDAEGNLVFLGRIDAQVKLRGYRIELAEIEALLLQYPGIRNAAVALKKSAEGVEKLVAYLMPTNTEPVDEKALQAFLSARLATYMIPSSLVTLAALPMLTSGKVDRQALPDPVATDKVPTRPLQSPRTAVEIQLYAAWKKRFDPEPVSVTDDFFDLGGNSLLASLLISELRQQVAFAFLSVKDLYAHRTIEGLARYIAARHPAVSAKTTAPPAPAVPPAGFLTRQLTASLQLLVWLAFYVWPVASLYAVWHLSEVYAVSLLVRALLGLGLYLVALPAYALLAIAVKWIVIGRFKAGVYPLWGVYHLRFWVVKLFLQGVPTYLLTGTPLLNLFYRALGVRMGKGVYLGTNRLAAMDLLTISDGVSIAQEASLSGYRVERGQLIIGPITVGEQAVVGLRAVLETDTTLAAGAMLDDLSLLPGGQRIPAREHWQGSPAVRVGVLETPAPAGATRGGIYWLAQTVALLLLLLLPVMALVPEVLLYGSYLQAAGHNEQLMAVFPLAALYVISMGMLLVLVKRVLAGPQRVGRFSMYSLRYVRKWLADATMAMSLRTLKPLYATIYTPYWMRMMGVHVGKRAEISTVNHLSADQLYLGDEVFLADSVSIGAARVRQGLVDVQETRIGYRSFIGNSAVLAGGTTIGRGSLIGALSTAPAGICPDDTTWIGSPALLLPNRPVRHAFPEALTFAPSRSRVLLRGAIELLKIILPFTFMGLVSLGLYWQLEASASSVPALPFVGQTVAGLVASLLGLSLVVVGLKWLLIGRHTPSQRPLWSTFVWRNELVNALCESVVYPYLVGPLLGTPMAPLFFRLMGSRFGRGVYLETTEITEFDLVRVADGASLNADCTIQTHLFEDRIMKMSYLTIGADASVGASAVILYDAVMKPGATLSALSLLMKGESLPANTHWQGIPSTPVG